MNSAPKYPWNFVSWILQSNAVVLTDIKMSVALKIEFHALFMKRIYNLSD